MYTHTQSISTAKKLLRAHSFNRIWSDRDSVVYFRKDDKNTYMPMRSWARTTLAIIYSRPDGNFVSI